jgi:signal transduction histidine kinase
MQSHRDLPLNLSLALAGCALLGGALSLAGWVLEIPRLIDWWGTGITIKTNTAICLVSLGAAAVLLHAPPALRAASVGLASLAGLIGIASLCQHLFDVDLGIDTLLFDEPAGSPATSSPNRMGPPAAIGFALLAIATICVARDRCRLAAIAMPLVILGISMLSMIGYLYGATEMYTAPRLTGISVQTATMLAALACSLLAAQPDRQPLKTLREEGTAGELARRLVPIAIIAPVLLGYLRLLGQRAGLYDLAFGTAVRTIVEIIILSALLWWTVHVIRSRDQQRRDADEARYRDMHEADRRKDEFLATLAHELRNPLAPIRAAAMLARKPDLPPAQRQWCNDVIDRQVQRMSLLLDDLLDVSRITRGTLELRRAPTSLVALVEAAIETVRPLVESKQHVLRIDLPGNAIVDVDALRMSQVVSNLLNNAAKYTPSGGAIRVSARIEARDLVIEVADDGIGIAAADIAGIFNMFSQLTAARERSDEGLGIGLALTRGLVELHGGTVAARSDGTGHGSTFSVRIPQALVPQVGPTTEPPPAPGPAATLRILVADDNRDAAESLAQLLELDGHEVELAMDGEAALAAFREFAPQVALLDIGMPRMNGYELARRIRELDPHIRLIAITGWGQQGDRERSAIAGFDHHLTKPVDYEALVSLLAMR